MDEFTIYLDDPYSFSYTLEYDEQRRAYFCPNCGEVVIPFPQALPITNKERQEVVFEIVRNHLLYLCNNKLDDSNLTEVKDEGPKIRMIRV